MEKGKFIVDCIIDTSVMDGILNQGRMRHTLQCYVSCHDKNFYHKFPLPRERDREPFRIVKFKCH